MRASWRLPEEPGWSALYAPVEAIALEALERLQPRPSRVVDFGSADALPWVSLTERGPQLSRTLLVGGARAGADESWAEANGGELGPLAPDRWRRAAGALLEGLALAALAERWPAGDPMAWWRVGRAVEAVDRAAPQLGGLWMEAVDLRAAAEQRLAERPRRAAWLVRWLRGRGFEPLEADDPPDLTDADLAAFGAWIRDGRAGPSAQAPVPLPLGAADGPDRWDASPWSFRAVSRVAGAAGLLLEVEGAAVAGSSTAASGEDLSVVLADVTGGAATLAWRPLGPLGSWELTTGDVGGRLGAARGVVLELKADGRLEIRLADAFMGLPTPQMVELAESIGVSGWASGRWRVVATGPELSAGELLIESVASRGLTMHPRGGHSYAVPAAAVIGPAERILASLSGARLRWASQGDTMTLAGAISGMPVELRLRPER